MVTPPVVEQRQPPTRPHGSGRLWPTLAIVAIVALLCTNAVAWYMAFNDDTDTSDTLAAEPEPAPDPDQESPAQATAADPEYELVDPGPNGVHGRHDYRGTPQLDGTTNGGFRELQGIYWDPVAPGGLFGSEPTAYGTLLYVASSTNDVIYAIRQTNGEIAFSMATDDRMLSSPVVGKSSTNPVRGETGSTFARLVGVAESGTIYFHNALGEGQVDREQINLGSRVAATPLAIDGKLIMVTEDATVIAIWLDGREAWRYPIPNTYASAFRHTPATDGRLIYAVDEAARVHMIDIETGEAACPPINVQGPPLSHPVVAGRLVLIPSDGAIRVIEAGVCDQQPQLMIRVADPQLPPAAHGSTLFFSENSFLKTVDLEDSQVVSILYSAESRITTPPTIAEGVLYFGTYDGFVHAIDIASGEQLWVFNAGQTIFGGPVVTTNGIFVTTTQEIFSIAGK